eukprot:PITA_17700
MQEEYQSIIKNGIWEIIPRPSDKSIVTSKWIYKNKHIFNGSIDKYKVRFVARGFSHKERIYYEEIFTPTTRYTTIRSLVSLDAAMGWNIHQIDVKTTFMNGTIDEELYIEQVEGFEVNSKDTHVCRLKKALYCFKQAHRAWYETMDGYLLTIGFVKSTIDPNLYIKVLDNEPVFILLYVDDLFITSVEQSIQECKKTLAAKFEMNDLGLVYYYQDPKHILRYIRGTIHHCLKYDSKEVKLIGFTDSNWGASEIDGRSTTSGCFHLGFVMFPWISRKKYLVALSSVEEEYVAACEVGKEVVWLRKLLTDLFKKPLGATVINYDNQSCMKMSKDLVFHARMKHINNKFHYIRNLV